MKDFNLSNISKQDKIPEDKLSDSSLSNKMAHYNKQWNKLDKMTDGGNDDDINLERILPFFKNQSNQDNLKRLSVTSLWLHNHMMNSKHKDQLDLKLDKERSNNSNERNSIRMHPSFIRSVSKLSNLANYEPELSKNMSNTAMNSKQMNQDSSGLPNLNELSNDLKLEVISLDNNDDPNDDGLLLRAHSQLSNYGDFSFMNDHRRYSKRNSLISNLSLILGKPEYKDDQ